VLRVTDAFTGTAVLGPAGRGALGQVLACGPGRIEHAPLGGLHDRSRRHQLRQALVGAVADDGVLLRLADATLADLAPGMSLLPDAQLGRPLTSSDSCPLPSPLCRLPDAHRDVLGRHGGPFRRR
jgi:hypothetical protein